MSRSIFFRIFCKLFKNYNHVTCEVIGAKKKRKEERGGQVVYEYQPSEKPPTGQNQFWIWENLRQNDPNEWYTVRNMQEVLGVKPNSMTLSCMKKNGSLNWRNLSEEGIY